VSQQGEVFLTTTVKLPDTLLASGHFSITANPTSLMPATVNGQIILSSGSTMIFRYDYGKSGSPVPALVEIPYAQLAPWAGQSITIELWDLYGTIVGASPIYILWTP
jgi:hypothetical protein